MMCLVLLAAIPMAAGMATPNNQKLQSSNILDVTFLRGFVLFKRVADGGQTLLFFAIRIHYTTIGISGYKSGVLKMRPMQIPNSIRGIYLRLYMFCMFHGDIIP